MGYRILDPFPFFSDSEKNLTEHGNLSMYDAELGWKGVPGGKTEFVTGNNRVALANNGDGFRDIEHNGSGDRKPAVVFLGDSYTWGFEVGFDDMFVNRLRDRLPRYEVFNLAHRGYGTDQELLGFKRWHDGRPLALVILMFYKNDIDDNNYGFRNHKPKPHYTIVGNELVLTGVPVPQAEEWANSRPVERMPDSWRARLKNTVLSSHFFHDIYFRYNLFRTRGNVIREPEKEKDLTLTSRILAELKKEVESRGAKLVVFFIPTKAEILQLDDSAPYQIALADVCQKDGIEYLDLAPAFKASWLRTYYRSGGHWNAHGNQVAADAIYAYLTRDLIKGPDHLAHDQSPTLK